MLSNISNILWCQRLIQKPISLLSRKSHGEAIRVTWGKPDIGWTKLNFDGSSKGEIGTASIGGVFRNHKAEFLLGYAEPIGISTSTVAELAALVRGLELVLENGWYNVWLEGDNKTLIDIIVHGRPVMSKEVERYVRHIKLIIPELFNFKMTHIYREGNRPADKLAQMGHKMKTPQIWQDNPPDEVLRLVREDAEGKSVLRKR